MRLIDADELMDAILWSKRINSECALEENAVDTYDNGQQETFELVIKMVEDRPTAYDVDKVVEQLEEKSELARKKCTIYPVHNPLYDRHDTQYQDLKMCLEIVKGGGVNE